MRYVGWLVIILGVQASAWASDKSEQYAPYPTTRSPSPASYQLGPDTFHVLIPTEAGYLRPAKFKKSSEHAINGEASGQIDDEDSDDQAPAQQLQNWTEVREEPKRRSRCNCDCYCSEDTRVNILIITGGTLAFGVIGGGIAYLLLHGGV